MGSDQTPVLINGKIYYVCCQGCEESLKNNPSTRVSRDPHTGKEVDKADAFIVIKPNGSDEVLYFESSQAYENFLKGHAHHGNGTSLSQPEDRIFTCPMHPDVRQNVPGSCPKCGMTLQSVEDEVKEKSVEHQHEG